MKASKEIIFRGSVDNDKDANSRETVGDAAYDVPQEFSEKLKLFPQEVRDAFTEISPDARKKLFESIAVEKEDRSRGLRGSRRTDRSWSRFMRHMFMDVGTEEDLEEKLKNISEKSRHDRNEWTEDEVRRMDEVRREIVMRNTLGTFLVSIDIEGTIQQDSLNAQVKVKEVMDSIWSNREKKHDKIILYRETCFRDIEHELALLLSERKHLTDELNKLGSKKSMDRQTKKRFDELKRELAKTWGIVWWGVDTFNETFTPSQKRDQLWKLSEEMKKEKSERAWQSTLAFIARYMDATDFSVLFAEELSRRLRWAMRNNPKTLNASLDSVEEWHNIHNEEKAIEIEAGIERSISLEKKREKLRRHFWRLFDSYLRLKDDPDVVADGMQNTAKELAVVLNLLK